MIALFLAVLELVKMQAVSLAQNELFGEIVLEKHEHFEEVFQAADLLPPAEDEYK
jgi:segregation and condensation protein A